MGYMKFTMGHPFAFLAILFFVIIFPVFFLLIYFGSDLNLDIALIISLFGTLGFIALIIIPTVFSGGKKEFNKFIKNLQNIVVIKNIFLKTIETKDFKNLKIIYFGPIDRYSKKNKNKINDTISGTSPSRNFSLNGIVERKARDLYKNAVEFKFSFSYTLPKSVVKINVPEFNYKGTWTQIFKDFDLWKENYPGLKKIYDFVPSWIDKLMVFYQDDTVFVTLYVDGEFCLDNSVTVYNTLVEIKNKLSDNF